MDADPLQTTALLKRVVDGDPRAQQELYGAVSAELRRCAGGLLKSYPPGHTLQPTALVHEAWIRLVSGTERSYSNQSHFLSVAARAMRSILVDHRRAKGARKRGGDLTSSGLDEVVASLEADCADLLDLDEALAELERDDPELARIVELRFFGGLSQAEVAAVLGVSLSTIERSWRITRARLHRRLGWSTEAGDGLE